MVAPRDEAAGSSTETRIRLRIIATSDLHASLWPYDYLANAPAESRGLTLLSRMIRDIRDEASNCLLLDNGDTIEGTPLADVAAAMPERVNPMIQAMNALGYDAAVLGNHDFNFGMDYLLRAVQTARFPYVLTNLDRITGEAFLPRSLTLKRVFRDTDGQEHDLRVAVVGVTPPQVLDWEQQNLKGRLRAEPIVPAALRELERLRREDQIDLAIALCHSGVDFEGKGEAGENEAVPLAATGAFDAVVAGHSHVLFPGPDCDATVNDNSQAGLVGNTAVVQPGAHGEALGLIDLEIVRQGNNRWKAHPVGSKVALPATTVPDAELLALTEDAHERTVRVLGKHLGRTSTPLASYFDTFSPSSLMGLVTSIKMKKGRELLAGGPYAHLPVLAAASPGRTGGALGSGPYTDIPAGDLHLRHVFDLYPFSNHLTVLKIDGGMLRSWLEHSGRAFNTITPDGPTHQMLLNPQFAGYAFDAIRGVTYDYDITAEPWQPGRPGSGRVRNLRYDGEEVTRDMEFLIVTNSYRAGGGGGNTAARGAQKVLTPHLLVRDVIADYIRSKGEIHPQPLQSWGFVEAGGVQVVAETGAGAAAHADQVAGAGLTYLGLSQTNRARFELTL